MERGNLMVENNILIGRLNNNNLLKPIHKENNEERMQKEEIIANELSKLPEVAGLYVRNIAKLDPIEQIAQSIDYLVETIRVIFFNINRITFHIMKRADL